MLSLEFNCLVLGSGVLEGKSAIRAVVQPSYFRTLTSNSTPQVLDTGNP